MSLDLDVLLARESAAFVAALNQAAPSDRVPGCPDWTAADLAFHLAEVQSFWTYVLTHRPDSPAGYVEPDRPEAGDDLLAFVIAAADGLQDALAGAGDGEPAWTWFPPVQTVGFTRRRQVHEALIHRVDAEQTVGLPVTIEAELAADGVLEVLTTMHSQAPGWAEVRWDGPAGTTTAADTGDVWPVQLGRWSGTSPRSGTTQTDRPLLRVGDPAAVATFAVTGTAADLDLWLWNRTDHGVELAGDAEPFATVIRSGVH